MSYGYLAEVIRFHDSAIEKILLSMLCETSWSRDATCQENIRVIP